MSEETRTDLRETVFSETSELSVGDLSIDFTDQFAWTWDDKGDRITQDGSTWRPVPRSGQSGYYPVGDVLMRNYQDPSNIKTALLLKDKGGSKRPALMPPIGARYVWNDQIWMLIAPPGYVALGGIGYRNPTGEQLSARIQQYRCVREDLVIQALVGNEIYNDHGSGQRDDLSCWSIAPGAAAEKTLVLSPGTFLPMGFYHQPEPVGFWAFELAMTETPPVTPPAPPQLTSKNPPVLSGQSVQYVVHLPWFSVVDPGLTDSQRMNKSPMYAMVRTDTYKLAQFKNNNTKIPQTQSYSWTEGVSTETLESFQNSVGIEIGASWTIDEVFSVSAKLSYTFTYTTSTSTGMQSSTGVTDSLTAPPYTAVAAYTLESSYVLYRQDGKRVQTQVPVYGVPMSTYDTQFPE